MRDLQPEPPDWTALLGECRAEAFHLEVRNAYAVPTERVVTVPHTDYHRWLLSVTDSNTAAGEVIRYLPRHLAGEVPPDDWWLIDNERVVYNLVGADGKPAGLAIPYREYISR
ncbi:DUF6879 family protein [Nocardia sp. NPDC057227]|uniref:DUF6879 family protein n=1 Tax=Nocardia sp. NPDC057227 TaxID=3346056 RepID=UPI0036319D9C